MVKEGEQRMSKKTILCRDTGLGLREFDIVTEMNLKQTNKTDWCDHFDAASQSGRSASNYTYDFHGERRKTILLCHQFTTT